MASITATSPRKSSNRAIFVLAVVFGLVTAVLAYVAVTSAMKDSGTDQPINAVVEKTTVVVSAVEIPAREVITLDMLATREVGAADVQPGTFSTVEEVVGSVNLYPTGLGQQILATNVSEFGADTALSYIIPEGHRALAVNASSVKAAGGYVLPGDFVDVIGAFKLNGSDLVLTATLAQDAEVLAVERQPELLKLEEVSRDSAQGGVPVGGELPPEGQEASTACSEGEIPPPDEDTEVGADDTSNFTLADSERCDGIPLVGEENPDALYLVIAVTPQEAQRVFQADFDENADYRLVLRRTGEHQVQFMPVFVPVFGHCGDTADGALYGEIPENRRILTEEEICDAQRELITGVAQDESSGTSSEPSEE